MTAEEYIKSKRVEDCVGGHYYYKVSEEDALKAVEMARNENKNSSGIFGESGWICPKCGRVYSPFVSMCSYCGNFDLSKVNCAEMSERLSVIYPNNNPKNFRQVLESVSTQIDEKSSMCQKINDELNIRQPINQTSIGKVPFGKPANVENSLDNCLKR